MLSTTTSIKNFVSGGNLFAADFKVIDLDTIHVHFIDEDGIEQTELSYVDPPTGNTEFNITDITDTGFNVNLGANSDANGVISVRRVVDEDQLTHWPTGGAFPAITHERSADKITMLIQQLSEAVKRVLRTPFYESSTPMIIPELKERKDGIMGFDSDGNPQMHTGYLPKIYSPTYTYSADNIIQYNGHFFIALQESTGNIPTGGTADLYWKMLPFDGLNYQSTVPYMAGDISEFGGIFFKSLVDDNLDHFPTTSGTDSWWVIVQTNMNWAANINFVIGDIVISNGALWECFADNRNVTPGSNSAIWKMFLDKRNRWNPKISYTQNDPVFHNGIIYIASNLSDNLGKEPGVSTTFWTEMNVYGSRWDNDVDYLINDITSYNGTLVRAIQNNKGKPPNIEAGGDETYWEVVKTGGAVIVEGAVDDTDAVTALNLVYFDTDGTLSIGDKSELSKSILSGFAITGGDPDEVIEVQSKGLLDGFTGLVKGSRYYLGEAGGIALKGEIETQDYIVPVGVAKSNTIMDVNIGLPEPTRNQDDGNPVGSEKFFSTYKDRSAYGYRPFCFGEDALFSKANFPVLYAEVGDIYEAQHIAAGDTASDSDHFYGVPVPGAYERAGIPDIDYAAGDVSGNALINITHHITRNGTPFKLIGNDVPAPLVSGTEYFIIINSATSISFATTEAEAVEGTAITLTDSGSGTFRLTQEGITLDDAFQGHDRNIEAGGVNGVFVSSVATGKTKSGSRFDTDLDPANNSQFITKDFIADGTNGTPRVINETRPKTNISFGYIKVEHVTTSGEPISALRYQWEDLDKTSWEAQNITVTHNLNTDVKDLIIKVETKFDGFWDWSEYTISAIDSATATTVTYGLKIIPNNTNSFRIITGANGIRGFKDSDGNGVALVDGQTGSIRVTVIKPNLVSTIFDVSSRPHPPYDLTSENITVTLPAITGVLQTKSIYWTNGGTYKLTLAVTDGATVGGETAGTWEGEGNGHILVESDGSNWQVREYEDYLSDTGNTAKKFKDGTVEIRIEVIEAVGAVSNYTFASKTYLVELENTSDKFVTLGRYFEGGQSGGVRLRYNIFTNTDIVVRLDSIDGGNVVAGNYGYNAFITGRWK